MQYNHKDANVQTVVTLRQEVHDSDRRTVTHHGANGAHVAPNTGCLYVRINDKHVAVYASGQWESAVTHAGENGSKEATRLVKE